jgi:NAD(P)-dependent dehydrogenase (short-subunit alcohol dehydrogenase family)
MIRTAIFGAQENSIGKATGRLLEVEQLRDVVLYNISDYDVNWGVREKVRFVEKNGPWDEIVWTIGVNYLTWSNSISKHVMDTVMWVNCGSFVEFMALYRDEFPEHRINVVVVSSDAARNPMRASLPYCASKAALDMSVKVLAREIGLSGRVNAVAPSMVAGTRMTNYIDSQVPVIRRWTPEQAAQYEATQLPTGRISADEVAEVISMVLDGPEHQTGSIIDITGGK